MIVVYITCQDKEEAEKIGTTLVKEKLAACCNFFQTNSIYRWKGKIEKTKESVLIVKTIEANFKKIEHRVKGLHSYTVPCILKISVNRGANKEYLKWLEGELKI